MARKMSFLKLVLPSANSETTGHAEKNDDPNLLLARSPASLDCRLPRKEDKTPRAMLLEDGTNKGIHSATPTSSPDSERETDSSPQKGRLSTALKKIAIVNNILLERINVNYVSALVRSPEKVKKHSHSYVIYFI